MLQTSSHSADLYRIQVQPGAKNFEFNVLVYKYLDMDDTIFVDIWDLSYANTEWLYSNLQTTSNSTILTLPNLSPWRGYPPNFYNQQHFFMWAYMCSGVGRGVFAPKISLIEHIIYMYVYSSYFQGKVTDRL